MDLRYWFAILVLLTASPAAAQSLAERSRQDKVAIVPQDDPAMVAAIAKARATLPAFLALVRRPRPGIRIVAVKVPLSEGDDVEYFWITEFHEHNGRFTGTIDNAPDLLKHVRIGQTVGFAREEIADWMYVENGRMVGNFTACALMKREDPVEAEEFKKQIGLTCQD